MATAEDDKRHPAIGRGRDASTWLACAACGRGALKCRCPRADRDWHVLCESVPVPRAGGRAHLFELPTSYITRDLPRVLRMHEVGLSLKRGRPLLCLMHADLPVGWSREKHGPVKWKTDREFWGAPAPT